MPASADIWKKYIEANLREHGIENFNSKDLDNTFTFDAIPEQASPPIIMEDVIDDAITFLRKHHYDDGKIAKLFGIEHTGFEPSPFNIVNKYKLTRAESGLLRVLRLLLEEDTSEKKIDPLENINTLIIVTDEAEQAPMLLEVVQKIAELKKKKIKILSFPSNFEKKEDKEPSLSNMEITDINDYSLKKNLTKISEQSQYDIIKWQKDQTANI